MIHPRGPMCLVGVWKVSNTCLEGITIVPEFWMVSGRRYQEGFRKESGRCLEGVWNKNPHLICTWRKGLICLEGVWKVSASGPICIWKVSGVPGFWKVSRRFQGGLRNVFGKYLEGVWNRNLSNSAPTCKPNSTSDGLSRSWLCVPTEEEGRKKEEEEPSPSF